MNALWDWLTEPIEFSVGTIVVIILVIILLIVIMEKPL